MLGSFAGAGVAAQMALATPAGAVLTPGTGSITGTVTVAGTTTPAADVCVGAEFSDGSFAPTVMTASDGTYTIANLEAGTYYITFFDGPPCPNNTPNYADNFYNGTTTGTMDGSTIGSDVSAEVTVTNNTVTPNINGELSAGGTITGTVKSATTGDPLAGVCVFADWTNGGPDEEYAATNASGVYTFTGLDPQNGEANVNSALDYTVNVSPSPYCSQLNDAQYVSQSYAVPKAELTSTQTTGFDVTVPTFSVTSAEVPTVGLGASANPVPPGSSVTYTASLSLPTWPNDASSTPQNPPAPTPTGTLSFFDNGAAIAACTAVPVSSGGAATCTQSYGAVGAHSITATYTGDDSYAPASASALGEQVTSTPTTPPASYDLVGTDGGVFVFGQSHGFFGSLPGLGVHVNNVRGIVPTANHEGYFLVGTDGGVFAFGNAPFENSLPGIGVHVNDIVGIVPTANDQGYYLVGTDGGVFAFGNAPFENSLPGIGVHVNDIVGIVPTADDGGYWVVGSNGTVYGFGDAANLGSVANPSSPIVGITATPSGGGYWLVSANGTVYPFGNAVGEGTLPGLGVSVHNIVSIVPTADGKGYWLIGSDGGVFAFGDAPFGSSLPAIGVSVNNIVGAVATA